MLRNTQETEMNKTLKHRWSISHNYLTGITIGKRCKFLAHNNFAVYPAYYHRAAVITLANFSNSVFAAVENARYRSQIKQTT